MKSEDKFIIVYDWMIQSLHLSGNELILYALIHGLTANVGVCRASSAYLGQRIGIPRITVIRLLAKLQDKGLIEKRQSGQGQINEYITKDCIKMIQRVYQNDTGGCIKM